MIESPALKGELFMGVRVRGALLCLLAAAGVSVLRAQSQPPTFGTTTRTVAV